MSNSYSDGMINIPQNITIGAEFAFVMPTLDAVISDCGEYQDDPKIWNSCLFCLAIITKN